MKDLLNLVPVGSERSGCVERSRDEAIRFQNFYNLYRTHTGLEGRLSERTVEGSVSPIGLDSYQWRRHCRGLYQTTITARFIDSPGTPGEPAAVA